MEEEQREQEPEHTDADSVGLSSYTTTLVPRRTFKWARGTTLGIPNLDAGLGVGSVPGRAGARCLLLLLERWSLTGGLGDVLGCHLTPTSQLSSAWGVSCISCAALLQEGLPGGGAAFFSLVAI